MGAPARALRETVGNDAMADLQTFIEEAGQQAKDEMLLVAGERFERRPGDTVGGLRIDMAKEFADVKVQLASTRAEVPKWSFLFWIGQVAVMTAIMSALLAE